MNRDASAPNSSPAPPPAPSGPAPAEPTDETENRSSRKRGLGVAAKLYLGLGAAFALTLAASLVGSYSFLNVGEAQRRINEESVPDLISAFVVAQHSSALVAAAPRLIAAGTEEEYEVARAEFARQRKAFEEIVAALPGLEEADEGQGEEADEDEIDDESEGPRGLRELAATLIENLEWIEGSVERRLEFARRQGELLAEIDQARSAIGSILVPEIDDQTLFLATGYRTLDAPPVSAEERHTYQEISRYRALLTLSAQSNLGASLLGQALEVADPVHIRPIQERFGSVVRAIERAGNDIDHPELEAELAHLMALGTAGGSAFRIRENELRLVALQQEYLSRNQRLEKRLVESAERFVATARAGAAETTAESESAVRLGVVLLFTLNVIAIVAVVLIGWLLVGRSLVKRITSLAASMRRMAGGDLETSVDVGGHDEVTEMADALEVFRQHALEVQRLNLVEMLADEVQAKNVELEGVLSDLRKAQNQVVLQEKLAALGQLTAGVAHEIKNPLNFIKNFSETSRELAEEMKEVLDEAGDGVDDGTRKEFDSIAEELDLSLEKINEHSLRADSIVRGMLSHSRESTGESEAVDINRMLVEYANLAYHSRRASDSDFNITLHEELGEDVGTVNAVAQDLSRVFLNIVTNACQATDMRRRAETADYRPSLWLKTKRSDDMVEVRIRDNGPGIPEEVRAKIFEPFFTTKETNEGTGLGLSISNDIVHKHGGTLVVETQAGEFTEFIVTLPVDGGTALEEVEQPADAES